jgi:hypothetical protein
MVTREDIKEWVLDALQANGGRASLPDVGRHIWEHHERDLRQSGDLFYTWQYDMRWAATKLRQEGIMRSADSSGRGMWELTNH